MKLAKISKYHDENDILALNASRKTYYFVCPMTIEAWNTSWLVFQNDAGCCCSHLSRNFSRSRLNIIISGAPWVRKFGKLPIRENLAITWPYTDRPSAPQVYQCKISGSLWCGFFGAKTNGNPRFVKHKQLKNSGKSTQNKNKFIANFLLWWNRELRC